MKYPKKTAPNETPNDVINIFGNGYYYYNDYHVRVCVITLHSVVHLQHLLTFSYKKKEGICHINI